MKRLLGFVAPADVDEGERGGGQHRLPAEEVLDIWVEKC